MFAHFVNNTAQRVDLGDRLRKPQNHKSHNNSLQLCFSFKTYQRFVVAASLHNALFKQAASRLHQSVCCSLQVR